jgi:hypothetical protein
MADHKAEQIMDAFVSAVTGLTTTGSNIERDRAYMWEDARLPALAIYQGDDTPTPYADRNYYRDDYHLTIHIDIHVKIATGTALSQTLNLIRKEITAAIQADPYLGLSGFVIDCEEGTALRPVIEFADKPTAVQTLEYRVRYWRARSDASA